MVSQLSYMHLANLDERYLSPGLIDIGDTVRPPDAIRMLPARFFSRRVFSDTSKFVSSLFSPTKSRRKWIDIVVIIVAVTDDALNVLRVIVYELLVG